MKKNLFTLIICMGFASSALAAAPADSVLNDPKFNDPQSQSPQISVANDKSAIDVAPPYVPKEPIRAWWDFGVSTWSPSNLVIPTSNSGPVTLTNKMVDLYLNDTSEIFGSKIWSGKIGLNWRPMQLNVANSQDDTTVYVTQSSQLISVRLGVEVDPPQAKFSTWLQGYAEVGVLPTFVFTGRGGADNGSTFFGLLGELQIGARVRIIKGLALDLAGMGTLGDINGSRASGAGFNAGLRIEQ